ncbi:RdgB/HAM1 family non-canonical purine NTP pyrophosphatase [Desulfovibrio sp. SGI.169]|uniref:RdgB/HAM1 family non-canonical purine NTP pyrophosphatase n=1 Tax=Desulfovibrio sp. SGI.169 TaxID=3420561 RepID=UPI003D095490
MAEAQRQRIVLATHNAGKVRELAGPLADFGVEVMGLEAFPDIGDIEESGASFEENALIKARAVAGITGLISVADDSGLMVEALNGSPGVYSARYADDWQSLPGESRDQRNIRKLLHELAGTPEERRACCFVSCMAAVKPGGAEMVVRGVWEGRLLDAPRGENGFGYDPVFFDPLIGKSAAQLSREEKNSRSHRGNALRALLARWEAFAAE